MNPRECYPPAAGTRKPGRAVSPLEGNTCKRVAPAFGGSRRACPAITTLVSPAPGPRTVHLAAMAWRFRRSLNFGPLKLNLSRSGVGYSIGGRGFRVGKDAKGRSYTAASIPGTGLYNRTYSSQGKAAGGNAAPLPGASPRRTSDAALGFLYLLLAFGLGALVVFILTPHPAPPPAPPPTAVSAPIAPPPATPVKRRAHHAKRAAAPEVPHPSPATAAPQALPPSSDAPPPAN
jgi:hypothetical protein